jgi:hypothetical protein
MLVATVQNLVTQSLCSYWQTVKRTDIQADKQFLEYTDYCIKSPTLLGNADSNVLRINTNMNTCPRRIMLRCPYK